MVVGAGEEVVAVGIKRCFATRADGTSEVVGDNG